MKLSLSKLPHIYWPSLLLFITLALSCGPRATLDRVERALARPSNFALYLNGPEESPVDLTVVMSAIEVQAETGLWHKVLEGPVELNSLAVAGKRLLLGEKLLPQGNYQKIRFTVSRAFIVREEEKADLMVPEEGFEYIFSFQLFPREATPLFLNWDVVRSVAGRFRLDLAFTITSKARAVASALIYVTSEGTNRVTVIDRVSGQEVGTIPVGNAPRGILLLRDRLYVANTFSHTISVIDATSQRVTDTVNLRFGDEPETLAVAEGRDLYVVNSGSNSVAVIDTTNLSLAARLRVGSRPVNIAVDGARRRAYVVNELSGDVSIIDTFSRRVVDTVRVESRPYGVAVDAARGFIYVSNMGSSNITIIDAITGRTVDSLNVGTGVAGLAVDPGAGRLYLARARSGEVLFYHPGLKVVVLSTRVGEFPFNLVVDRAERRIYVVNRGSDTLTVLDQNTARVIKTIKVGTAPYKLALQEAGLE